MRREMAEALEKLERDAREARREYWWSLGDGERAHSEPSRESLNAWKAVVVSVREANK